jgi:hypothetical protein
MQAVWTKWMRQRTLTAMPALETIEITTDDNSVRKRAGYAISALSTPSASTTPVEAGGQEDAGRLVTGVTGPCCKRRGRPKPWRKLTARHPKHCGPVLGYHPSHA